MLKGFKQFIFKGNVVDLAIAVIIGAAFGSVVNAFVKDLLTPLIAAIGGQPDFSSLYFTVNNSRFLYGDFLNAVISFLIVGAAVYYFVVVPMSSVYGRMRGSEAPTTRECPECMSVVPIRARRCAHCTAIISPVVPLKTGSSTKD